MHKWRRILIIMTVLVGVVGVLVCWDVYRAQAVAIDTLTYASAGKTARVQALIDGTSITNRLYNDIAPYEVIPVATPSPSKEKEGFLQRMWDKGASLFGGRSKPTPEPEAQKTIDLQQQARLRVLSPCLNISNPNRPGSTGSRIRVFVTAASPRASTASAVTTI
jgi:hypothetical protein